MVVGDIKTGKELVVIGAGPGGYTAAIRAAQRGMDVMLIDKEEIGGTCLNRGCIPAKAFIHASKFHQDIKHWNEIGIHAECEHINFSEIQEWKTETVEKLNKGVKQVLDHFDVEFKQGEATFINENTVRVEEEHNAENIEFEKAIIATGSQPIEIPGLEFEQEGVISSRELLQLEEVPEEIVVVGGGYIGMEAVTKFCKFGATVKVVEARDKVLANFDKNLVNKLQELNKDYGDKIHTSTKATGIEKKKGGKYALKAEKKGEGEIEIEGDYIMVAAGRTTKPIIENLGLENTDVSTEEGFIETDEQMKTSQENILAIGDTVGQPMLAHKAYTQGRVAGEVAAGRPQAFDNKYIPKVMYTDPEVAVVGMSPEEAKGEYGADVKIGKFPFSASGRALTINDTQGFVKVIASPEEKILGVQVVGARASGMIAEATLALEMQAYLDDIINTIHAHPTFPEALLDACEDAKNEAIHTY